MRIAIVNDMVITAEALKRVVLSVPGYELAWVAKNGLEAVANCAKDTPDLVLMDLIMPGMDGVEATRWIMKQSPCAILLVTADVKLSQAKVFEAMGYGALDAVNTPILGKSGDPAATQTLLRKIALIEHLVNTSSQSLRSSRFTFRKTVTPNLAAAFPLIAIGASTGGPKAIATILSQLPKSFGGAIIIVQHVDAQFAEGMIDWLNHQTALPVRKIVPGDRPEKGVALVACTNDHLRMQVHQTLTYGKEPTNYPYRPSIDVFFKSLAKHWPTNGIAVLLTGMGRDGAEGLSVLRKQGWHTIAQDQISCVVYGMPKIAKDLNAAVEILNPDAIAASLRQRANVSHT